MDRIGCRRAAPSRWRSLTSGSSCSELVRSTTCRCSTSGQPVRVEVDVRWTLHGVSREKKELVRVLRDGTGLRARSRSTVVLAEFGVVVKSTKVLFAEIKVGDAVTVTYDLRLLPVTP